MEAPEKRELPLNIPMVTAISQAMRLKCVRKARNGNGKFYHYSTFSVRTTRCQLLPILMLKQLFPSPLIHLILISLMAIYQSYGGNWPITFYPTTSKA